MLNSGVFLFPTNDSLTKTKETIGDCYVAATGLPNPQEDHAVRMVKFATDCVQKLTELLATELVSRLGPDTGKLCMRFGLHSGQVTAGVLRGEKARFQVFGDTVNTASVSQITCCRASSFIRCVG